MGLIVPGLFLADVMHARIYPRRNTFSYRVYYLAVDIENIDALADGWRFGVDGPGVLSFYRADHGARDGSCLRSWLRGVVRGHGLDLPSGRVVLLALPRVLGYVFNPVSFWLCHDNDDALRMVVYEVNNTFGETHTYICRFADGGIIGPDDIMRAEKIFHVSPFLQRCGHYNFRTAIKDGKAGFWIDYYEEEERRQLLTALTGHVVGLDRAALRRAFWTRPLVTFAAIARIHWQAVKLLAKGIKYVPRPRQKAEKSSVSNPITKI